MKRVFTRADDVIHLFAQKQQTEARSSNVFMEKEYSFEGNYANVLYSYGHHYELARFIDKNTVLINDRGYSVTTSKHISIATYALNHYRQFFETETDLDLVLNQMKSDYGKWIKARKPEMYVNNINYLWERVNEYIDYRKKKCKRDARYCEIKKIHKSVNNGDRASLETYRKQKAIKERAKRKKEFERKLDMFYRYEINYAHYDKDYLRISKDGQRVETTQGVRVSVESAKKLYSLIKRGVDVRGVRIENFTVTSINGTLKIGCHNIDIDSVHKVGRELIKE